MDRKGTHPIPSAWERDGRQINAHGACAQRSDPEAGNPARYSQGLDPQGDGIRIYNCVRCVHDADVPSSTD